MNERKCAIVDAYSAGRYLPEEFKRYGIGTVHVMSAAQIPPIFQSHFNADLYDEVIRPSERMGYDDIVEYHLQALRGRKLESLSRVARPKLSSRIHCRSGLAYLQMGPRCRPLGVTKHACLKRWPQQVCDRSDKSCRTMRKRSQAGKIRQVSTKL